MTTPGTRSIRIALIVLTLAAGLASLALTARALSPDDGPAIARALRAATGHAFNPQSVCGRAAPDFPDIVVMGGHVHDLGCVVVAITVADRPFSLVDGWAFVKTRAGWAQAAPAERGRLALAWTRSVLLGFQTSLERAPDGFARADARAFTPPAATALPDGGVRVDLWIQEPPGMEPVTSFVRVAFTFTASGEIGRRERLDGFEVPIRRQPRR